MPCLIWKKEREINKNKKEVVIYADDGVDYQNVSAYADLTRPVKNKDAIKIYWKDLEN